MGGILYKKFFEFIKKKWSLFLLIIIFLLALGIRIPPAQSKWLSAYDPYMQYRHTEDVAQDGFLSSWDEMSYYPPGRPMSAPPLMYYVTGYLYFALGPLIGISLMKFCGYMAAIYGAIGALPAYLLGKEFSGKRAGLLSAFFIGMSQAILSRTTGGFYDTDGLVIFFSLLCMYLLVRALREEKNYVRWGTAILGLVLFGLTWVAAWYIPMIVLASLFVYFVILILLGHPDWKIKSKVKEVMIPFSERIKKSLIEFKKVLIPFLIIFGIASIVTWVLGYNALGRVLNLIIFAQEPARTLIVNISVAELQPLNVFGGAWKQLFGRIGIPLIFTIPGALLLLKRDRKNGAILLTWAGISFFAITRGIRFMLVFAPAACIASGIALSEGYKYLKRMGPYTPLIGFGFLAAVMVSLTNPSIGVLIGILLSVLLFVIKKEEKYSKISKSVFLGTIVVIIVITLSQGSQAAMGRMSEPINKNWENAYMWLKKNTAKDAVVGSWWDPGHRISGIAERRNIADGAHCSEKYCNPGLNTRIVDLGKIFVTDSETEAKNLLLKYRGNASEIYWIASDDLIGKFRWLQYFGTGCDGTGVLTPNGQRKCPLYSQLRQKSYGYDPNYTIKTYYYQGGASLIERKGEWIATMKQNNKNYLFEKEIYYKGGEPQVVNFGEMNNTVPGTAWVHPNKNYLVYIPPNLENSMFTRMFFYEENETLDNFELVFKNKEVKIYELIY